MDIGTIVRRYVAEPLRNPFRAPEPTPEPRTVVTVAIDGREVGQFEEAGRGQG
jgi:hypothetical protein